MTFDEIFEQAKMKGPKRMAVSGEGIAEIFKVIASARDMGLVTPIFIGPDEPVFQGHEVDFIKEPDLEEARIRGIKMAAEKDADIFMDTAPLSKNLLDLLNDQKLGLKKRDLLSYVSVYEPANDEGLTIFTDTYINNSPDLKDKVIIVENAIDVAASICVNAPKIAALAALEKVNPAIDSTVDAAALAKMSDRSQFGPAIVEGPLGMDNAESALAAENKGIRSPVPGNVDIYLFPDIESAYVTTQFLFALGQVRHGGILGGVEIPLVTLTPLDTLDSCLLNIALATLQ